MPFRESISDYSIIQNEAPEQVIPVPNQSHDYSNFPVQQMYEVMKEPKESDEYKTFKNFLQFKSYLDFTERLERDGIITINRPREEVIEIPEKKRSPLWAVIAAGFILIKIGMMIA